ncbi:NAD-dependent epimerase/dehydratase family protein [Thermobispora bispora]|uniref:NAD-dependent epimerase/dehydratase n=1 Tax=Thermobispora bispora (strain ATCC 19993 / DSM 43833 / CBS 139.67 / JCM 10125 / KCTC 9307 / NBRC 14880 / R51) TaxID=469371 RepID=D6Y7Y8_THEBD|nr:NAD(P)-dependent oxidoreductase [Thermobispora bispora]ADG87807.1 NAD-dependent epimerase/dehydratase [Thermobispora bispora DSM 43833]MDI9582211.1 NAD(P)-dependent oxidoreductase [Thermobispora sp.]
MRILITGAAGGVGTLLRPRLARQGRVLRLLDIAPIEAGPGEEAVTADITDPKAMAEAMDGVDAVLHLGGHSLERAWEEILHVNIHGTYVVLEAARRAGVRHAVLASSNHAAGFHPRSAGEAPDYLFPRPDTYYGVSKVAVEALGSLYHDRYGMHVTCLRIGSCFERPKDTRMLSTWLSPDDCARLVEAALTAEGFHVVWGISANTRRWWSLEEGRAIGYEPQDDAEVFAAELIAEHGEPDPEDIAHRYLGGAFCGPRYHADNLTGGR